MKKIKKLPKGKIVPLKNDLLFKKVFGDIDGISRLEGFIASYFNVPYNEVKGNVRIIESEKRLKRKSEKRQSVDIVAEVELISKKFRLNIEMNLKKGTTLYRNFIYATNFLGGLNNKEDYSKITPIHQISFDAYDINPLNSRIIKRCFIKDETNTIIHNLIEIDHIDIVKCNRIWYDETINNYEKEDRNLIRLGALVTIEDEEDFKKCLEEISMENDIKEDIIDTVEEYSEDDDILRLYYDREQNERAIRNGDISLAKAEGAKEKSLEIAKNMLKETSDIEFISRVTKLSKKEVENLKELS